MRNILRIPGYPLGWTVSEGPGISQQEQHQTVESLADMANSGIESVGDTGPNLTIYTANAEKLGGEIGCEIDEGNATKRYFNPS